MTFITYLEQKKLSAATVNSYSKYISYFTGWLQREDLTAAEISYTELLDFVRYLQVKSKSKRTINHLLGIVRHYFTYLVTQSLIPTRYQGQEQDKITYLGCVNNEYASTHPSTSSHTRRNKTANDSPEAAPFA